MSSLNSSLSRFQADLSSATSRNIASSRPASTGPTQSNQRTSTPQPGVKVENGKRSHDTAFAAAAAGGAGASSGSGSELLTQVWNAVRYLKEKSQSGGGIVPFDQLIGYLSLPIDGQKNVPLIKRALQGDPRAEYIPKAGGKDGFKYRPTYPITNGEELTTYLSRPTEQYQGISVKDLKDGWPDCATATENNNNLTPLDLLELQGKITLTRNKKDSTPRTIYADSPSYHLTSPATTLPIKASPDFQDLWSKVKLPATENELRSELEKAGLTPTSQVKEVMGAGAKGKVKRRGMRKGGKTTNSHMLGILKEYGAGRR